MNKTKERISVSTPKFEEIKDVYSSYSISITGKLRGIFWYQGRMHFCSGILHSNSPEAWGYEIVPLESYQGDLEPLPYSKHWPRIDRLGIERTYRGILVEYKGDKYVAVSEERTFIPNGSGQQEDLFG